MEQNKLYNHSSTHLWRIILFFVLTAVYLLSFTACGGSGVEVVNIESDEPSVQSSGKIYLYGESHGNKNITDKEFELWYDYYHNENMRHLFVEMPYYTAEYLNIWMQSEGDGIFNMVCAGWTGTAADNPDYKEFFIKIKNECPETIFHGTDVGHQHQSTGKQFLDRLKRNNLVDTEQYLLTLEAIEQGKQFYGLSDDVYRENMMAENFIREFDKLSGESVMGIYGSAHTGLDALDHTGEVACMAMQLHEHYGDIIYSEDLSYMALDIDALSSDIITVNGKEYEALYFGKQDMSSWSKDYSSREFWRLENAYDNFKDMPKTGKVLPYNNYPMSIEEGQVFAINYTKTDGSQITVYYRSDGYLWNDTPSTEEFALVLDIDPLSTDIITISGKEYEASYFGKQDISSWSEMYLSRDFWRLENAYDDFKDMPKTGSVLPYDNYPMLIEEGQVFAIKYIKTDGSEEMLYYRSDGYVWNNLPSTEEFAIE